MTPLAIFLGLTPQQAIATGKLNGLAVTLGALQGFRKTKIHNWKAVIPVMVLASVIGIFSPFLIREIDNQVYRRILGVILLLMIPVLFLHHKGKFNGEITTKRKVMGYIFLALTLSLQAVFSSGMGVLVTLALMVGMGMPALEANVTKRFSQLVLNLLIFLGVVWSGLIVWPVALTVVVGSFLGSQLGARIALKKGETFVTAIFAILMLVSGIGLLV